MNLKMFPKLFLYTLGMMLFIAILAHLFIFYIAPTQNVLVTSTSITNAGTLALSEIDMPQLIANTMLKTFPISIACCVGISLIVSYFFSKAITTPILAIAKATSDMAKMDTNAKVKAVSSDEIGFLAKNINTLYQALLNTIRNLEAEKEKVSLAEKEKLDFLRAASHDLKTPVTELNATLENMMLNIGEFSNHEIYLPKCKEIVEQLGGMITDILNTSRLQMDKISEPPKDFLLKDFVLGLCEPYQLIAQTKGIRFHLAISGTKRVCLPKQLLRKAVSNILSNAIHYTSSGKTIFVALNFDILFISNECSPLPKEQLQHIFEPFYRPDCSRDQNTGGNGLGLYIAKQILSKLNVSHQFTPLKNNQGMNFKIHF